MIKILKKIYHKVYSLTFDKKHFVVYIDIRRGSIYKIRKEGKNTIYDMTRADSLIKMTIDALTQIPWKTIDYSFSINYHDYPTKKIKENQYFFCVSNIQDKKYLIPDFVFDCWPQSGIGNYDQLCDEISTKGKNPFESNKMLWIGNINTNYSRTIFYNIAQKNSNLIEAFDTAVGKAMVEGEKNIKYISLPDHTKYKYLIDIEGNGYSGRIGMLLFSRRVLFLQERKWKQYYYFDLIPYVHFIPVKNDFSDLLDQINFVEQQGVEYYEEIAQNALRFAQENLRYDNAIDYIRKNILGIDN